MALRALARDEVDNPHDDFRQNLSIVTFRKRNSSSNGVSLCYFTFAWIAPKGTELGARSQTPKGPQTFICVYLDIQMHSSQKLCWCIVKRESKCNFQEASQKVHHSQSPGWYCPQINDFPFSIFYIILKQCQSFD